VADGFRARLCLGGVRQHPAHQARTRAGRLRLGCARVCGRFWRLDDLVRLFGRCGHHEPVSRRPLCRELAAGGLACGTGVRGRVRRAAAAERLAPARATQAGR
jgi:hypothetical protein